MARTVRITRLNEPYRLTADGDSWNGGPGIRLSWGVPAPGDQSPFPSRERNHQRAQISIKAGAQRASDRVCNCLNSPWLSLTLSQGSPTHTGHSQGGVPLLSPTENTYMKNVSANAWLAAGTRYRRRTHRRWASQKMRRSSCWPGRRRLSRTPASRASDRLLLCQVAPGTFSTRCD